MTTFLISGASGYLGGLMRDYLRDRGHRVLTVGRRREDDIPADFAGPEIAVPDGLALPADATFLHLAAANELLCRSDPLIAYRITVMGTHLALKFCRDAGIERFVYVSTRHVFGAEGGTVTERDRPDPIGHYGLSHLLAEEAVAAFSGLTARILRPSNIFGLPASLAEFDRWTLIPFAFCKEAVEQGRIVLKTPGVQRVNFVSGASVAHAAERFLDSPALYHVAGPETLSVRDFAYLVRDVLREYFGREVRVEHPEPGPEHTPDLQFSTEFATLDVGPSLRAFVRDLCGRLSG